MLFSYGFDKQVIIWNLANNGGIVSSQTVSFDISDSLWIANKNHGDSNAKIITCGNDNIHIFQLNPFKGTLNSKPFNLKKIKRNFVKLFELQKSPFILCGSFSGDLLLLDLEFDKFLVKQVNSYTDISRAKHHMVNTYPIIPDTLKVTQIFSIPISSSILSNGNFLSNF